MPTITLKGIPDDLYRRLKQSASDHRRSINSEAIVCLEKSLNGRKADADALLARLDKLRERLALPPLTDESLQAAKSGGRP